MEIFYPLYVHSIHLFDNIITIVNCILDSEALPNPTSGERTVFSYCTIVHTREVS